MLVLHRCKSFDEFDLSICVESVDQKVDDGDLILEQSCRDCRLVVKVEREGRGIVVGLDFFGLFFAPYEGVDCAVRWKIGCILEFRE